MLQLGPQHPQTRALSPSDRQTREREEGEGGCEILREHQETTLLPVLPEAVCSQVSLCEELALKSTVPSINTFTMKIISFSW